MVIDGMKVNVVKMTDEDLNTLEWFSFCIFEEFNSHFELIFSMGSQWSDHDSGFFSFRLEGMKCIINEFDARFILFNVSCNILYLFSLSLFKLLLFCLSLSSILSLAHLQRTFAAYLIRWLASFILLFLMRHFFGACVSDSSFSSSTRPLHFLLQHGPCVSCADHRHQC
jgi:hypothetical protein